MSTPAHILSGAYIGVLVAGIAPTEISYILLACLCAGMLDFDHIYYFVKDRSTYAKKGFIGKMHHARSPIHEIVGLTLCGIFMLFISFFNLKLAFIIGVPITIHITEDIIMGRSFPLSPFNKTVVTLVPQKFTLKVFIDISIIVIFSLLWLQYLSGVK